MDIDPQGILATYAQGLLSREREGLPPLPLSPEQITAVTQLLSQGQGGDRQTALLLALLGLRVEPGVSKAAVVKAAWLEQVALGQVRVHDFPPTAAIAMLGQMGGGYNVAALLRLLHVDPLAAEAAQALKRLTKIYEAFNQVTALAADSEVARELLASWAAADWFTHSPALPRELPLTVYKVDGEINTDDFSPGKQAQSRADIPLHATFFGIDRFPGGIATIAQLRSQGRQVAFAGDVVGTGSSRKSAINSLSWHLGEDQDGIPNKRRGGVVLGATIAPIFYATARDAGVLALQADAASLQTGDEIILDLEQWSLRKADGSVVALQPRPVTLLDEYRAGGRLALIIGRNLTRAACQALRLAEPTCFTEINQPQAAAKQGYTLAQKMVGRACGLNSGGILPYTACEPHMSTVGSQDTTGPMTMQEINELACLHFKADLFLQSFCHTAAYPKDSDPARWRTMTETTLDCGGIALKPGDGVIHTWLNCMLVPDGVGTGGDSHTRFPLGISFPAGSGLVAFAAALGFMPLEMPESVLVRFTGCRQPGITVRDMVNAIPWFARKAGLLTVAKADKQNVFAGTILEIEGVEDLSVEEAFELSNASAERSAAACALSLSEEAVVKKVRVNLALLRQMVAEGYETRGALDRRITQLEQWLAQPSLLRRDENASYKAELLIDLAELTEPLLACPNDPDDIRPLSEVAGTPVNEAFVGSCMTHLAHLQQVLRLCSGAPYAEARLWVAPSNRLDREIIAASGGLGILAQVGARVEVSGCSLCMGNQARVKPGSTVISTSTRNFDNRLGEATHVFLGSAELVTLSALQGRIPTVAEYFAALESKGLLQES